MSALLNSERNPPGIPRLKRSASNASGPSSLRPRRSFSMRCNFSKEVARKPNETRAGARTRTADLLITNQLLSQLSYASPLATLGKLDRCGRAQGSARQRAALPANYRFCS